jgi:long-chain acyl-CoA synthetase
VNFLETIFTRLARTADAPVLAEIREGHIAPASASELLALVARARTFLRAAGLKKTDRCALLAPNSVRWAALDLALMAEGITVVPLYARQAPAELAKILRDASPALLCCGDALLLDALRAAASELPRAVLLDAVFETRATPASDLARAGFAEADPVTIIYTSGTSGEAKGVMLTAANVNHVLRCTNARLDALMGMPGAPDRIFHYAPFCLAASWILLLTALSRNSYLLLSTDLAKLAQEMQAARPHYFLNVPTLLERMRKKVEERIAESGGLGRILFQNAWASWQRRNNGSRGVLDAAWLAAANALVFSKIRAGLGPDLKALICGSAPLAVDTQLFFMMLGIPVLQAYGLTETSAICTLDVPGRVTPGWVGVAIPEVEMRLGENQEILVRGPNIFPGYWQRPGESVQALRDGWFHTGDQGAVDAAGNWRITGRLKSLIILNSGHNIAPEPLEELLQRALGGAQQVFLLGNNRSFLAAVISGEVSRDKAQAAIDTVNRDLPHYQQIRAFRLSAEPFTNENGLLAANGKLRRGAIGERFGGEIDAMYAETRR